MKREKKTNWKVFLITLFFMLLGSLSSYSATQNIDGTLEGYPYIDWQGKFSFDVTANTLVYCTRDFPSRFHGTGRTYTVKIGPSQTGPIINGNLVSYETFTNTLEPGLYGHFYEGVHGDVYLTPDFDFGKIIGHDSINNTIDILVPRTRKTDHYGNNPDTIIKAQYTDQANFFIEDSASTETKAMEKLGKWIQVHPPRQQLIWVETDASDYDYTVLPHYDSAGRGEPNSATGMAYFDSYTADGNIEIYREIHDSTVNETFNIPTDKSWLDGKICPSSVAIKPGREFAACCRREGSGIDEEMVRTRDDEIRGTITEVDGNSFTIEALDWDRNTYTTTVSISSNKRIWLDGNDTTESVIEVGREVRILPEREYERVVVLNEYFPGTSSTYQPVAYFSPDVPYAISGHEFTFDGTHSYDLDSEIVSYEWNFGDENSAFGPVVKHTFDNGDEYKSYKVVLTVTSEDGETVQDMQYITVAPKKRKAENLSMDDVYPGLLHKEWLSGCDFGLDLDCGEPDTNEIVDKTLIFTDGGLNDFRGYINAPEDGWYEFRLTGRDVKLWIDDWFVVDNQRDPWGIWNFNHRKGNIYLEAGLHPITFQTTGDVPRTNLIGWSGPGVEPEKKTIDELRGDGDGAETYARLVLEEDFFITDYELAQVVDTFDVVAEFDMDPSDGFYPLTVDFDGSASLGSISSYSWDFGDGNNDTGASTSHEFAAEGEYPVTLTVSDGVSSHQKEKIVYVYRDTIPIEIDLAYVVNEQTIQVIYTKEVDTTIAQNIANYSIDNGVTINDIELVSDDPKAVSISTSSLSTGTDYTLTISNVTDMAPIPNVIADNSTVVVSNTAPSCQITFDEPLSTAWSYMINCEDGSGSVTVDDNIDQLVVDASSDGCNTFYNDRDYWNGIISTPVSGNFEVYVQVMIPDGGETGSRGGIILGRNLSSGAGIAAAVARAFKGEFRYYYDSDGDGLMDDYFKPGGHSDTTWLRMVRMGNTITSYYSNETEPLGWEELGSYDVGYGDQDLQISLAAAEMLMHFDNLYLSTCPTGDAGDKLPQTIAFDSIPDKYTTDDSFELSATTTSGLDVSFSVVSGPASLSGDVVTLDGVVGEVTIEASQAGNEEYHEAPAVQQTFSVDLVSGQFQLFADGDNVTVLPNPAKDKVTISIQGESSLQQVYLYSVNGVLIDSFHPLGHSLTIDVSGLNPGIYLLKVFTSEGDMSVDRLIIYE